MSDILKELAEKCIHTSRLPPDGSDHIHEKSGPVRDYARYLSQLSGRLHVVLTVASDSDAYKKGYRFVCVPHAEMRFYDGKDVRLDWTPWNLDTRIHSIPAQQKRYAKRTLKARNAAVA